MRLVFAGTPAPAVASLDLLAASEHEVIAVVTRPDAKRGRGRRTGRSEVGQRADELGIPVLTPQHPKDPEFVQALTDLAPDCVPVVAYGALVPVHVLQIPRFGWVNLHFSLLPAWRGAAPVQRAIIAGDDVTGATTFQLEAGMDTGPMFGVCTETIGPRDTAGDLLERLAVSGARLLKQTMDGIASGQLSAQPQPGDGISYAPKLNVDDAHVDWNQPALHVDRLIRGCTPAPGAWTVFRGERMKIFPVSTTDSQDLSVGQIVADKHQVRVGTMTEDIVLNDVQPAGKKRMAAVDWARGVRLAEESFGES